MSAYTPHEDKKFCLVAIFLSPEQLEAEWRTGRPPYREFAKIFTIKFNDIDLRIPFNGVDKEVNSVVEAMKYALSPVCDDEMIAKLNGLKFKLQRTFAECGRESIWQFTPFSLRSKLFLTY